MVIHKYFSNFEFVFHHLTPFLAHLIMITPTSFSFKRAYVEKNILLKNYFHLKDDKNYVGGICIKFHFIYLS
jgi:hypothetical protein